MAAITVSKLRSYHEQFAPPSVQRFLSYISGWLSALGWQAFIAVAAYQGGVLILNLATLKNPDYVPTQWSITLGRPMARQCTYFSQARNTHYYRGLPFCPPFQRFRLETASRVRGHDSLFPHLRLLRDQRSTVGTGAQSIVESGMDRLRELWWLELRRRRDNRWPAGCRRCIYWRR